MGLVALSAIAPLAAMPLLSWLMRDALVDQVDDRVEDVEQEFLMELADDVKDITLAARMRALDPATKTALLAHDVNALHQVAKQFHDVYPEFDVLFYDAQGALVTSLGCAHPAATLAQQPFANTLMGGEFHAVVPSGCEQIADAKAPPPPAWTVAIAIPGAGVIVACLPLDNDFAKNVAQKVGVSLCLYDANQRAVGSYQVNGVDACTSADALDAVVVDRNFARQRFAPRTLPGVSVTTAMRVGVHETLDKHLRLASALVALAALLAMALGIRIASVMSVNLKRITLAHKKLEHQQYVKVAEIKTGDEIEDLAEGFNAMVDGLEERDRLRATMGKYMTEQVVEHLMAGRVQLGGVTLPVTVLFTDIRSFTSISETMSAHELVSLLNEYFTAMVTVVMEEGGVVDKYIGDAIMAVFGAPVPKPDDAQRAVRAAVRMRAALILLNERLAARGIAPIRTGIGLHTGEVVAGNIGSEARMEYTVIGDGVNLASRLESATKELGVDVLISEDTAAHLGAEFELRYVDEITVKGRKKPVKVFEVKAARTD